MKRQVTALALLLAALARPGEARAEWFYLGAQAGGQYLDLSAISGGQVFAQAIAEASTAEGLAGAADFRPEPTRYSAENALAWGAFAGVHLGIFRLGGRFTHSAMDVVAEDGTSGASISFGLNLFTVLLEGVVQIPISILRPFVGVGLGYAFLQSETTIVRGDAQGQSELGTSCFDVMASVGLDVNLGRWFALGVAAHFSFIGFYYEDPSDPSRTEAAWGFATDYLLRATLRI